VLADFGRVAAAKCVSGGERGRAMKPRTYKELFQEQFQLLSDARKDLKAWQCRLELKRLQPGLFQAIFGRTDHEKCMGAVDYHLSEGCTVEEACQEVVQRAPELAEELAGEKLEEA
jgi:hypothetical protein